MEIVRVEQAGIHTQDKEHNDDRMGRYGIGTVTLDRQEYLVMGEMLI